MTDGPKELTEIPREIAPPRYLAGEIAGRLRREGLLRGNRTRLFALASAAIVFVGIITGVVMTREARPAQPRYILLLYDLPGSSGGSRTEYANWAREMRPFVVGGEELDSSAVLSLPAAPGGSLAGYFLIDAGDDATAARIARACPHLRHGGAVVLRRIIS